MKSFQSTLLVIAFLFMNFALTAQCFTEQTFTNPGESTFTVPGSAGESFLIEIEAKGADGGDFLWGINPQTDGGEGATMKASYVVPGGSNLLVIVGTSGSDAIGSPGGGGGGGGTAVIIDNAEVLIAAGAGGGGGQGAANTGQGGQANTNSPAVGGLGLGSSGGGGFNADGGDGPASMGGGAGTLNGQGAGGTQGVVAGPGGAGFGGGGGGSGTVGGGGGGYKGGDGSDGAADLNGKGGDSYVTTLYSSTVIFNTPGADGGGSNNNGSVIINCIPQGDVEISLISKTDPTCFGGFGGSIEVGAVGGIEPYQYSLNGGTYGDSPVFTGLTSGDYTVTVQDGTGATATLMVSLIEPTHIIGEVISVVDNVCFGGSEGSIEVSATGGTSANGEYGYSLNGSTVQNSGLFINLPNGFYVISIFDDNLCNVQLTAEISSPDNLELIVLAKTDVTCFGLDDGSCSVEAFGGTGSYTFSLDDGPFTEETIYFDLSGGTHIITVMDEEECTEEVIFFIDEPDAILFDLTATTLTCHDDTDGVIEVVNLMGTAPFLFKLNDGAEVPDPVFTGLAAGEYIITVIDSAGCEVMDDIDILNPDSIILNVEVVTEILCEGDSTGAVMLEAQNGTGMITYSVDQSFNFTGLFENLGAGEYTASATDENGCATEVDFELQQNATINISDVLITHVSCFGGADGGVTLEVSDGIAPIQYAIDGVNYQDSPAFSDLMAGEYSASVTDSTGCVAVVEITIDQPSQMEFDYVNPSNIGCYGGLGGVDFIVVGGTSPYFYQNADGDVIEFEENEFVFDFGISAGDYILSIEDSNGCILADTVTVTQNDSLQIIITNLESDDCSPEFTGLVELDAVGGIGSYQYTINSGPLNQEGIFDSLPAGSYSVTVFDSIGCNNSITVDISQLEGLVLDSFYVEDISCVGADDGFIELFVSNGEGDITYWIEDQMFSSSVFENLAPGPYYIEAIDENGCSTDFLYEMVDPIPLSIEVVEANLSEGFITVAADGGTLPYRYSIDNRVTFQESTTFTGLEHGDYTIIVIDGNGCESSVDYSLVSTLEIEFSDLKVFPNPVNDILHIEYEGGFADFQVEILNKLGQAVRSFSAGDFDLNGETLELHVDGIETGSYILKLRQNDKEGYRQIVIVR